MINFQVTISNPAAATPLIAAGAPNKYASWLVVQYNAGAALRMGGPSVTATSGIAISTGGGSVTGEFSFPRGCCLNNVYLFGTAGNIIDITYEPSA